MMSNKILKKMVLFIVGLSSATLLFLLIIHSPSYAATSDPGCYTGISPTICPLNGVDQTNKPLVPSSNCYQLSGGSPVIVDCTDVTGAGGTPALNNPAPKEPSCKEIGGQQAWLICNIIDGITSVEGALEQIIIGMLKTPPLSFSSTACTAGTPGDAQSCIYQIWSNFRIYGDVFLVIALLIAVIVEAVGGGMVSSYTIRKMLPRIVVAVILINLSIYVVAILEDIFNILGGGLYDLIRAPFGTNWKLEIHNSIGGDIFMYMFGGLGVLAGGLAIGGLLHAIKDQKVAGGKIGKGPSILAGLGDAALYLIMFVVIPIVIAILGVVLTLMFRQAILIFLLMISPVAFALYCLPNTEQYFRKWWDLLLKTLMVYPVVIAVFCMAEVMAIIFDSNPFGLEDFLAKMLTILAVAAPIFLVPFAFKISGGLMGTIHGGLNKATGKLNDAYRGKANDPNSRQNKYKKNMKYRREQWGTSGGAIANRGKSMLRRKKNRTDAMGNVMSRNQWANVSADTRMVGVENKRAADKLSTNDTYQAFQNNDKFHTAMLEPEEALKQRNAATDPTEVAAWDSAIAAGKAVPKSPGTLHAVALKRAESGLYKDKAEGHDQMYEDAARSAGPGTIVTYDDAVNKKGANGFSGSSAGVAKSMVTDLKSATKPKRADLATLGSDRYTPTGPGSAMDSLDFGGMAAQTVKAHEAQNDHYETTALSVSTPGDMSRLSQHVEELRSMATSGRVPPAIAAEAARSLLVIEPRLLSNDAYMHWSTDPPTGGGTNNNLSDAAARARKPL